MTDKTDTRDLATTPIRVWCAFNASGVSEACEPRDFLGCESEDEVWALVVECVEETATRAAYPDPAGIAALWAAVQALRERGE
jgi:hypothetical protein